MRGLKTNKTTINDDHSHTENGHLHTHTNIHTCGYLSWLRREVISLVML